MEAFFGGRSKLSFVKTSVLTSTDGGNTFQDKKVDVVVDDEGNKLSRSEIQALNKPGVSTTNLTLYEQLKKNKEEKDKLWQDKHGPHAPKALEVEDVQFLNQVAFKETTKRMERKQEEERELATFYAERHKIAQQKNSVNHRSVVKEEAESRNQSKKRQILGMKRKVLPTVQLQPRNRASKGTLGEGKVMMNSSGSEVITKDSKDSVGGSGGALDFLQMYEDDDSDSD